AAGKPGPAAGTYSRLRTQPISPEVQRGASAPDMRRANPALPPALPARRYASISGPQQQGGSVGRPSMPSMNAFRGSSGRAAAPAPQASMPSFSRGSSRPQQQGGSVGRPSMPSMNAFRGSSGRAAAPAPQASMPSFSRGSSGGNFSRGSSGGSVGGGFGGSHGGSFSHGGGVGGGGPPLRGVIGGGQVRH